MKGPTSRKRVWDCIAASPGINTVGIAKLTGVEAEKIHSATSGLREDGMIRNVGSYEARWQCVRGSEGPPGASAQAPLQPLAKRESGGLFKVAPCELERVLWPPWPGTERTWVAREHGRAG